MSKEEQARLLESAAHCLHAAAHLLMLPGERSDFELESLIRRGRELAAFAAEMAKV